MKVTIPTPLRSYTKQTAIIDGDGATIAEVLADIERRFSGFRFRIIDEQDGIREHIKIFVNDDQASNLQASVRTGDTVHIICALSGG